MLQSLANHLVGVEQVGCRDTLAVRRIDHDDALLCGFCEILEVGAVDSNVVGKTGGTHIQAGCIDSLHIDVVSVNMVCELTFLRVVVVDGVEKFSIIIGPLLECKFLAEHARTHVVGNKGSLYGKCT